MFQSEFTNNKVLQWALGALAFNYFIIFHYWIKIQDISKSSLESFSYICPPYWQNCDAFYFLQALPLGYSQTFVYMLFFAALLWVVYLLSEKKWHEAQLILIPFFLWHAFNVFFYTETLSANYEFYVVGFGLILLFFPHKEFFLKLFIIALYVLSVASKMHPSWIEGGYFNNMSTGLPLFPNWSIPLFSNLVILMEMIGAWFLLSKHKLLQRGALIFFVLFHLYSGILVEYRYPATVLPMLLILFGPWYRFQKPPLDKKSIIGWCFIVLLVLLQFSPKFIYGDEKLTLEGNKYGLYMFESNHQCISNVALTMSDGSIKDDVAISASSRDRCNPYEFLFIIKNNCILKDVERIAWTFDHSINGDPFLRIVDEENACNLEYKPFSHNEWIKTHADNPEVIGYPVENYID